MKRGRERETEGEREGERGSEREREREREMERERILTCSDIGNAAKLKGLHAAAGLASRARHTQQRAVDAEPAFEQPSTESAQKEHRKTRLSEKVVAGVVGKSM
jgi:hypothetical protein